jgi:alpha-beta hydrolase superfamily lysophospholipase
MRWRRLIGGAAIFLAAAGAMLAWTNREQVVAQTRAIVVLTALADAPVVTPLVGALTREPVQEEIDLAGAPTTMVRPPGDEARPAIVFITGADKRGRKHPQVVDLARSLARAGFVVYLPDLPGLKELRLAATADQAAATMLVAAAERPESAGGKVTLASISAGASLALVAAGQPEAAPRVRAVAGIAPFADLENMLLLAITGKYIAADGELAPYETGDLMRTTVERSLRELVGDEPLAQRFVDELLERRDPEQVQALYDALDPSVRDAVQRLSPVSVASQITAPVRLASPPRDPYFPTSESERIVSEVADGELVVTTALDHAIPRFSREDIAATRDFNAWLVGVVDLADERG